MIYRSPFPDIEIPNVPVAEFVLARAAERGDRPALVDGLTGRTITYAQLPDLVARAAAALAQLGLKHGQACAIFSPNAPEYAIAVLAILHLGAIVTTASPLSTRADLVKQIKDSRAEILLSSAAVASVAVEAAKEAGIQPVVWLDAPGSLAGPDVPLAPPSIQPHDVAALPYSSGTTGLPKGVMLSHRNIVANLRQLESTGHLQDGEDTLVCFLPFFHIYGLTVLMLDGLRSGATLVVMSRFDLAAYFDLVDRYGATVLHVVPPVVVALAKSPLLGTREFPSVRKLFSGAAPLGAEVIAQATSRVGCLLQQGYGMTEASPATHCTPEHGAFNKPGSIGIPVASTECRIVDVATGEDVAPGQDGEIWVRGPQVMLGYFNCPEETSATVDADGWLHTGDIGRADEDGCVFVVDRLKELIKYKGMQIAPAELEAVLLSHPAVADAGVVPQPDAEAGEIPHAYVVPRSAVTPEELMAFVAEHVSPFKKVRRITFIDAIPKSPSGKILRRVLRDLAGI